MQVELRCVAAKSVTVGNDAFDYESAVKKRFQSCNCFRIGRNTESCGTRPSDGEATYLFDLVLPVRWHEHF